MIWTLVVFFIAFLVLRKYAFGPLAALVEKRRTIVRENLEAVRALARGGRDAAGRVQAAARPGPPRGGRDRRARAPHRRRARAPDARGGRRPSASATIAAAKAAIAAETRQAIDQIKNQVADLTLLATEKVVGRALDEAEGRRLVEEALAEVDFSQLGAE